MAARKPTSRKAGSRKTAVTKATRSGPGGRFVSVPLARDALEWLEALYASGALVVDRKGARLTPVVKQLLEALHEALAGGKVSVTISARGEADRRRQLDEMLSRALASSNASRAIGGPEVFAP